LKEAVKDGLAALLIGLINIVETKFKKRGTHIIKKI
jgi:hypothetical protein